MSETLLQETVEALKEAGKTPVDVLWVGTAGEWFTWAEFAAVADVEYDPGYGSAEVATNLVVVFEGGWLERGEYDGSEWWDIKVPPTRPEQHVAPERVVGGLWPSLKDGVLGE